MANYNKGLCIARRKMFNKSCCCSLLMDQAFEQALAEAEKGEGLGPDALKMTNEILAIENGLLRDKNADLTAKLKASEERVVELEASQCGGCCEATFDED